MYLKLFCLCPCKHFSKRVLPIMIECMLEVRAKRPRLEHIKNCMKMNFCIQRSFLSVKHILQKSGQSPQKMYSVRPIGLTIFRLN